MRLRNKSIVLCGILFALFFTSCTTFKASNLAVMPNDPSSMVMLGHFERNVLVSEFLGSSGGSNLFNLSADAMEEKLTDLVWSEINKQGGNGAINVEIEYEAGFLDILANYITSGIWAPAHLKISGNVIRYGARSVGQMDTKESIKLALLDL